MFMRGRCLLRDKTLKQSEPKDDGKRFIACVISLQLWCTSHRRNDVVPALKQSLQKLDLDYVDMFLIHWPMAMQVPLQIHACI